MRLFKNWRRPSVFVATTYFAEGFPYGIVNSIADLFFTDMGASLKAIGLTSLFHIPWNLKFLLGPVFDAYESKRRFLIGIEVLLSLVVFALALFASPGQALTVTPVLFLLLGTLSAMHDIAIDGYYMEALSKDEQALFVGFRVTAYRVSLLVCTGPLVVFSKHMGWNATFAAMGIIMAALLAFHAWALPVAEVQKPPLLRLLRSLLQFRLFLVAAVIACLVLLVRVVVQSAALAQVGAALRTRAPQVADKLAAVGFADWLILGLFLCLLVAVLALPWLKRRLQAASTTSTYAHALSSFLEQPHAGRILVFIVLFRIGESFLMKMKFPFLKSALGVTLEEYGYFNGVIGMVASLIAPSVGGYLIAKRGGLQRFMWPFMLLQNGLHLLFTALAVYAPQIMNLPRSEMLSLVTVVVVVEVVGAGFGTAAFTVFILKSCRPEHKAAHMALLTALMSVSFTLAGVLSGVLAEAMGFAWYFAFTFVVTVPGMLMTPWVPRALEPPAAPQPPAPAPTSNT